MTDHEQTDGDRWCDRKLHAQCDCKERCESPRTLQTQSSSWCATCGHEFRVGDRYIEDTSSGFVGEGADPAVDDLMADLFGGSDGKVLLCENCTEPAVRWSQGYQPKVWAE